MTKNEVDVKQYIIDNIIAIELTNLILRIFPNEEVKIIDGKIKVHFKPNTIMLA